MTENIMYFDHMGATQRLSIESPGARAITVYPETKTVEIITENSDLVILAIPCAEVDTS